MRYRRMRTEVLPTRQTQSPQEDGPHEGPVGQEVRL